MASGAEGGLVRGFAVGIRSGGYCDVEEKKRMVQGVPASAKRASGVLVSVGY